MPPGAARTPPPHSLRYASAANLLAILYTHLYTTLQQQPDRQLDNALILPPEIYSYKSDALMITGLPTYADHMALPASARRCCSNRLVLSPARRSHNSKLAAAGLLLWAHAGTDRRTDGRTRYRFVEPASRTMQAVSIISRITAATMTLIKRYRGCNRFCRRRLLEIMT